MIAYKSTVFYDAGRTTYQFPFRYMKKSFVKAKYIKRDGTAIYLVYNRDYQISGQTLTLNQSAPADVTVLCIYRETPTDQQVRFVDASILKAYDLNTQGIQLLHIAEENTDTIRTNGLMFDDTTGTWHGMNRRLSHLSDPVNPQDAVTIHYLTAVDEARIKDMESLMQSTENILSKAIEAEMAAEEAEAESRSYAKNAKKAQNETIQQADTARNYALNARAWAQSDTSPDNDSNAKSSKTWAKESKDAAAQAKTAENKATEASSDAKQSALNAQAQAASARTSSESVAALMTHLQQVNLYNPSTTYTPGQCAMLPNGDVYRCIKACKGVEPGTDGGTHWIGIQSKQPLLPCYNSIMRFTESTNSTPLELPVTGWYRIKLVGGGGGGVGAYLSNDSNRKSYIGGSGGSGATTIAVVYMQAKTLCLYTVGVGGMPVTDRQNSIVCDGGPSKISFPTFKPKDYPKNTDSLTFVANGGYRGENARGGKAGDIYKHNLQNYDVNAYIKTYSGMCGTGGASFIGPMSIYPVNTNFAGTSYFGRGGRGGFFFYDDSLKDTVVYQNDNGGNGLIEIEYFDPKKGT